MNTTTAQQSGPPVLGYIHEVVWPDGTNHSFHRRVPKLMEDIEKNTGIPTHHISERYWPIYDPAARQLQAAGGGNSPDLSGVMAHGIKVYEINYGPGDKWQGVRLEDFNNVISKITPAGGFVVVPMEPTEAMLESALRLQGEDAFIASSPALLSAIRKIYLAMIAIAPVEQKSATKDCS